MIQYVCLLTSRTKQGRLCCRIKPEYDQLVDVTVNIPGKKLSSILWSIPYQNVLTQQTVYWVYWTLCGNTPQPADDHGGGWWHCTSCYMLLPYNAAAIYSSYRILPFQAAHFDHSGHKISAGCGILPILKELWKTNGKRPTSIDNFNNFPHNYRQVLHSLVWWEDRY